MEAAGRSPEPRVPTSAPRGGDQRYEGAQMLGAHGSSAYKMALLETEEGTRRIHVCKNLWKNICFWRILAAVCFVLFIFGVIFGLTSRPRSCSNVDQCVPAQKEQCPEGWAFYRFCFIFNTTPKSFEAAKNFCSLYNASLLEIESLSKLVWLKSKSDKKDYWIGLRNESGIFQWMSGAPYNDTLFKVHSTGECAYNRNNGIFLSECTMPRRSICEKSPDN